MLHKRCSLCRMVAWLLANVLASLCLPASTRAAEPQRWAILVGVNDYVQLEDLKFASDDADALARGLVGAGFPEKQIFLVRDGAKETKNLPIKSNIERQLDLVLNLVGKDDLVLVAFSGHGMHLDGKSYLCPTEANVEDPAASMIAVDDVYDRLAKCPAAMKLIVLDACRNDPRPAGKKSANPKEDAQKLTASFGRPPDGIWLLASCGAGQVSYEDQELKHGVFMSYLLDGLGGKADGNKNGKISLGELYEFASQETKLHVARKWTDYQVPAQKGELNGVFEFVPSGPIAGKSINAIIDNTGTKTVTGFTVENISQAGEVTIVLGSKPRRNERLTLERQLRLKPGRQESITSVQVISYWNGEEYVQIDMKKDTLIQFFLRDVGDGRRIWDHKF